jgi:hypothetical protein
VILMMSWSGSSRRHCCSGLSLASFVAYGVKGSGCVGGGFGVLDYGVWDEVGDC